MNIQCPPHENTSNCKMQYCRYCDQIRIASHPFLERMPGRACYFLVRWEKFTREAGTLQLHPMPPWCWFHSPSNHCNKIPNCISEYSWFKTLYRETYYKCLECVRIISICKRNCHDYVLSENNKAFGSLFSSSMRGFKTSSTLIACSSVCFLNEWSEIFTTRQYLILGFKCFNSSMKYDQQLQYRTMVNKLLIEGGLLLLAAQCSCIYLREGGKL